MKSLTFSVALVFFLSLMSAGQAPRAASQNKLTADKRLTNQQILEMAKAGLSAEIIVAKIEGSSCEFDTSPPALTEMKTAGVPDAVILAMVKGEKRSDKEATPVPPSPGPGTAQASGTSGVEETKAVAHFYRERAYVGSLRKMPIYVDEVKIADLVNGRFFITHLDPGKHALRCQTKDEAIQVQMEPGKEYYLRAELIQTFAKNHWRIVQVEKEQGRADIQRLKPLDPDHIGPLARTSDSD